VVTNSEHAHSRKLLLRMLQFFYKSFVLDSDGAFLSSRYEALMISPRIQPWACSRS